MFQIRRYDTSRRIGMFVAVQTFPTFWALLRGAIFFWLAHPGQRFLIEVDPHGGEGE